MADLAWYCDLGRAFVPCLRAGQYAPANWFEDAHRGYGQHVHVADRAVDHLDLADPILTAKLILITDLHITSAGEPIIGLDPEVRLRTVLDHALTHHSDADAIVLMGDLTHYGLPDQYAQLAGILADVPIPVIPMLGNHDRRDAFVDQFGGPTDGNGFVQHILDLPTHRVITLDTLDGPPYPTGHHAGRLCPQRMQWLSDALADLGDRTPLIIAHHPPFDTGIVGMDAIKLQDGAALLATIAPYPNAHLVCGHIHRTISGTTQGVGWSMLKSTCHQGVLDLINPDSSLSVDEPASYGVALLSNGSTVIHSQDVGFKGEILRDGHSA